MSGDFLERRTVSGKTPADGKLEITKRAAQKIEALPAPVRIELAGTLVPATLGTMSCTCRGDDHPHVHYFLESEHFKQLQPGSSIDLALDARGLRIVVRLADGD